MGPRSDERGDGEAAGGERCGQGPLQWGRARMSAEIRREIVIEPPGTGLASMGPRSDERGDGRMAKISLTAEYGFNGAALGCARRFRAKQLMPWWIHCASMGPRSDERGDY